MSRLLLLLPEAADELRAESDYYERRGEGLGRELERAFYAALPAALEMELNGNMDLIR